MDLIQLLSSLGPDSSPVLVAYRDEIVSLVESLGFSRYVRNPKKREVPVSFALYKDRPVLLVTSVLSDTVYNNVNQALNTPKKRAANFVQREMLPVLMRSKLSQTLKSAKLEYFGLVFVYGNRNFIRKEENATPESLALVMSTRDYVAFVKGEMTQEALLRNSSVFLAHEGPSGFLKVELQLE